MLAQFLVSGVLLGSLYGLVALGFAVIYKATEVFNFAQGMLMVCGAYLALTATAQLALPFAFAAVFVVVAAALIGVIVHRLLIRPLAGRPLLPMIMVTIALSIILRAGIEMIYGGAGHMLDLPLRNGSFVVSGRANFRTARHRRSRGLGLHGGVHDLLPLFQDGSADEGDGGQS